MVAALKVPMLKPGEYELWRMRMEQYIQMIDYSLWETSHRNVNAPRQYKKNNDKFEGKKCFIEWADPYEHHSDVLKIHQRCPIIVLQDIRSEYKVGEECLLLKGLLGNLLKQQYEILLHLAQRSSSERLSPRMETHITIVEEKPEILDEHWKKFSQVKWDPRNKENRNRENTRRVVPVETTTFNALVSCDGSGYDWSDQAEEGPTNFALMAYSSTSSNSEVSTDSNCSSSCLENVKILKEQNEQLLKDLRTSKINAITYKTGLESVEARLLVYKKNESVYEEDIKVLKREIHLREVAITELRRKLELAQKQKDEI
ncbi:hypothetical protein Tco_0871376 [Tanacetum coccineum]